MKSKILFSFLLFSLTFYSQTVTPIQADRPDQTETPAIVPKGMFQLEAGFSYQKENRNSQTIALPAALWKYGVNDNFELRLITAWESEKLNHENNSGLTPLLIGFKAKLCEEKGIIPKTSFIGHLSLPKVASPKFKTDFMAPEFRFTMQHTLSDKLSIGYNLGCEWNGFTPETTYVYTLTAGYSINDKLGSYIELFGFVPENGTPNHNFDGGFTYLINNNFMVDLSSGVGLTDSAPDYYLALGFSIRQ